jgi:tellurite resistance protein
VAYVELADLADNGDLDAFARILYYSSLFLTLMLLTQVSRFVRLHYYISWWAYSFPLAAVTIATLVMLELTGLLAFAVIGWVLLSLVTLVVIFLLYRTAVAIGSRSICVPHL